MATRAKEMVAAEPVGGGWVVDDGGDVDWDGAVMEFGCGVVEDGVEEEDDTEREEVAVGIGGAEPVAKTMPLEVAAPDAAALVSEGAVVIEVEAPEMIGVVDVSGAAEVEGGVSVSVDCRLDCCRSTSDLAGAPCST